MRLSGANGALFVGSFGFAEGFLGDFEDTAENDEREDGEGKGHGRRGEGAQGTQRRFVEELIAEEGGGELREFGDEGKAESEDGEGQR